MNDPRASWLRSLLGISFATGCLLLGPGSPTGPRCLASDFDPRAFDFNGDGSSDLLFQDANGSIAMWFMEQTGFLLGTNFLSTGNPAWQLRAVGDLNQDGMPDLVFQHEDGSLGAWLMNGTSVVQTTLFTPSTPGANWRVFALADMDGDGHADMLLQHKTGALGVWLLHGTSAWAARSLTPRCGGPGWKAVGAGDFNRDGNMDIVFQHDDGPLGVWFLEGTVLVGVSLFEPQAPHDPLWRVRAVQDLDGDGQRDLIFQHSNGSLAVWLMDGITLRRGRFFDPPSPGAGWQLAGPDLTWAFSTGFGEIVDESAPVISSDE